MNNQKYLAAKAVIATDLYHEGKITRAELFRNEVDLAIGCDSGPIVLTRNMRTFDLEFRMHPVHSARMRIVYPGYPPGPTVWQGKCRCCNCVVELEQNEVKDTLMVECPQRCRGTGTPSTIHLKPGTGHGMEWMPRE